MPQDTNARRWVWAAVALQAVGYAIDVAWHGLVKPGEDPTTVAEMARHLGTVHLPLYVGAAAVLIAIALALGQPAQPRRDAGLVAALLGAVVSAGAEAWHAYSHLQLDTHHAPVAGTLSGAGFLVVVGAMWRSSRSRRHHPAEDAGHPGVYPR